MKRSRTKATVARIAVSSLFCSTIFLASETHVCNAQQQTASSTPAVPSVGISSCPCIRYTIWDSLTDADKTNAKQLGYDYETWDMLDQSKAAVEYRTWDELNENQKAAAQSLGYDIATWDCCINHYEGYSWQDLESGAPTAHAAIRTLGYTIKQYWDNDREFNYQWCHNTTSAVEDICLNAIEIQAAKDLCHTMSTFRRQPMSGRGVVAFGGKGFVKPDHC